MNTCKDMQEHLVDYHKEELTPGERERVAAHLRDCPACTAELKAVRDLFARLQEELVPVEISAHLRAALHDRILAETRAVGSPPEMEDAAPLTLGSLRPSGMRPSERYLREMRKPFGRKVWDHARRSPYFAASIFLHAAAAVVLVALLVQLHTKPTAPAGTETADGRDAGMEGIYEYVIQPEGQQALYARAYHQRVDRPHVLTRGVREGDMLQVDVSQFAGRATLVGVQDRYLGMIRMYFADAEGYPGVEELMQRYPNATLCRVERNVVRIPASVADPVFGTDTGIRIFDMEDRLELWSEERWQDLENTARLVLRDLRFGLVCFLAMRHRFVTDDA